MWAIFFSFIRGLKKQELEKFSAIKKSNDSLLMNLKQWLHLIGIRN